MSRLIRRLLTLTVVLALLAVAGWLGLAGALQRAAAQALTGQQAAPVTATAVQAGGFPAALSLRLHDPALHGQGWGWTAPVADLSVATLAPNRLRLVLPAQQSVTLGGQVLALTAAAMGGALTVAPRSDLRLRSLTLGGQSVRLGDLAAAAQVEAAVTQPADTPRADIAAAARDLTLPPALLAALPRGMALPPTIAGASVQARLGLTAPLDRFSAEAPLALTAIELDGAALDWGDLALRAEGKLTPDAQGFAEGRVMVHVTGWRVLMPLLTATGVVKPEVAATVETALSRLAVKGPEGGDGRLDLPVIFRGGRVSLGPMPIGQAPRFP